MFCGTHCILKLMIIILSKMLSLVRYYKQNVRVSSNNVFMNKESIPAAPEGNVGLLETTEGIDQETKRFIEVKLFLYMFSFFSLFIALC